VKLFLVTLVDMDQRDHEFCQYNASLAELATNVQNLGLRMRAIEEVPNYSDTCAPALSNMTIGEAEKFRVHGPHDADVFKVCSSPA